MSRCWRLPKLPSYSSHVAGSFVQVPVPWNDVGHVVTSTLYIANFLLFFATMSIKQVSYAQEGDTVLSRR